MVGRTKMFLFNLVTTLIPLHFLFFNPRNNIAPANSHQSIDYCEIVVSEFCCGGTSMNVAKLSGRKIEKLYYMVRKE